MTPNRTQVAIIGAGPSGLLLGQLLHKAGIDNVIIERQSATMCWAASAPASWNRSRWTCCDEAGVGAGVDGGGTVHHSIELVFGGARHPLTCTA
jgi:p-hydroxybenzoate 3-monooxygenase